MPVTATKAEALRLGYALVYWTWLDSFARKGNSDHCPWHIATQIPQRSWALPGYATARTFRLLLILIEKSR